jgi:hypothetical protein
MPSPQYKISYKPKNGSKVIKIFLYTHLRSLNAHHFGISEAKGLKM